MMKKLVKLTGVLSASVLVAACQDIASTDAGPSELVIENLADHYHTGDEIELTVVPNEETNLDNWQWYVKEDSEWEAISGLTTGVFSREATIDGLQVKVALMDENNEKVVESEVIEIPIDDHGASNEIGKRIYNGFFYNDEIIERTLADFEGDWQSVYPYLLSGDLNQVFEEKARNSEAMNTEEYKEYYAEGYITDVDRIAIEENQFSFFYEDGKELTADYEYDGYEVLTYARGNRGVRFIFQKANGAEEMPQYIQFSDHAIFPTQAHHFHLYWGGDRAALLEEVINWPTYYPSDLDAEGIVSDMLAH